MDQSKPELDELAITRSELKQVSTQLSEKDFEITALKEELALLSQGNSATEETEVLPASFNIVHYGWDLNG